MKYMFIITHSIRNQYRETETPVLLALKKKTAPLKGGDVRTYLRYETISHATNAVNTCVRSNWLWHEVTM